MVKTKIAMILGLFALVFVAVSQAESDRVERSFSVNQGGTFYIDTDSGSIDIESHNNNTVDILVEKKGSKPENFELSFSQDGNDVSVEGDQKGIRFWGPSGAHFTVKVPQKFNVDIETKGGSIRVSDLQGKVDAYTSGGSIRLGEIIGDVNIKTSGGSIRVDDVAGAITAHTSGGSIKVSMSEQPEKDSRLTTSGGSVSAKLLSSIAVDLSASTSGGRVSSQFDVDGTVKKTRIKGEINGGGPELVLKTSGGSVTIRKL